MNITDKFLNTILSIKYEDITPIAIDKLRICLADTISVAIAGAYDLKAKQQRLLDLLGGTCQEEVAPIGYHKKTSLINAILVNGLSSHFLELDDGIRYGVIHPSAPLFAALLPVAEVYNVEWKQFVLGVICGYEVSIRIATSLQPYHYLAGYHPTATCCTLGVAVGISIMLNYSPQEVKDALSAATLSAYGTLKVLEDVSQLKPYNCGKAAMMGFVAAMMAKAGFIGPQDALGGDSGFLRMMASNYKEDVLVDTNNFFYIEKIYLKPYASCRHTHPGIEAALYIRNKNKIDVSNIERVIVKTYKGVIGKHDGTDIVGETSARMSIPYSIAIALFTGKAGIEEFTLPYIKDEYVLNLTKHIFIEGDEALSKLVPDKRSAIVTVLMKDGISYTKRVDYPKGEPENPMSIKEIYEKFISVMNYATISEAKSKKIFDILMKSESLDFKKLEIW